MKNVWRTGTIAMIIPLIALFFSCASAPYVQKDQGVLKLVDLINEGTVNGQEGLAQTPFALDTETLYLENDVATLWDNLHEAGFTLTSPRIVKKEPVTGETWRVFADSYDMKNFFARYTGKDTSLVTLETGEGTVQLLLEPELHGYPRIRGIKGPEQ